MDSRVGNGEAHLGLRGAGFWRPWVKRKAVLGWHYRGEYGYAEKEVREGSDRRHSPPLPRR
jgi:hypothetical protein